MILHYNEGFVRHFMNIYSQVKKGTADLEQVEELILHTYNNDEIYERIEEDDLMWNRLQQLEKYMNQHGIYYKSKAK